MHVSKEIDYGLRAMIVIASNSDEQLSSKEISRLFKIPYNFLSLILPKLVRNGLIVSTQGPKGGYRLSRSAGEITFLQIIEAIQGPIDLIACNETGRCELDAFCTMVSVWQGLKQNVEGYFEKVTLDRFVNPGMKGSATCSVECGKQL